MAWELSADTVCHCVSVREDASIEGSSNKGPQLVQPVCWGQFEIARDKTSDMRRGWLPHPCHRVLMVSRWQPLHP